MKILIICISTHNGNTERIAKAMAEEIKADIKKPSQVTPGDIGKYDIIGFGSGIINFKHHKSIFSMLEKLPHVKGRKAFIFSTKAFFPMKMCHKKLKRMLVEKGYDIIGEYSCSGLTTFGPATLIGGIHKGRPDESDLVHAKTFCKKIIHP